MTKFNPYDEMLTVKLSLDELDSIHRIARMKRTAEDQQGFRTRHLERIEDFLHRCYELVDEMYEDEMYEDEMGMI